MTANLMAADNWVPEACTLPTVEQPLRSREFDDLFGQDVLAVVRESPGRTRFELRAEADVASRAAALAVKESGCCSFFAFELSIGDGEVTLSVGTAAVHQDLLAALTRRAELRVGARM